MMKITVGFIVGIAVGIGIGILVAPDKGSETRKSLAGSTGDWMKKIKDIFSSGAGQEPSASWLKNHPRAKKYAGKSNT
jgi:gas vesicle protein